MPEFVTIQGLNPTAYESITVAGTAIGLTAATHLKAQHAIITVETAQVRVRFDGTAPTATEGHIVDVGDVIHLNTGSQMTKFKAIRTGTTSGVLKVTYLF